MRHSEILEALKKLEHHHPSIYQHLVRVANGKENFPLGKNQLKILANPAYQLAEQKGDTIEVKPEVLIYIRYHP